MPANLLGIASELRNEIYALLLLEEEPIRLASYYLGFGLSTLLNSDLSILRVNKAIQREASAFLYARNCFDCTLCVSADIASFLAQIGEYNASCIRHLRIDFPTLRDLEPGNVTLQDESGRVLASIRECCPNVNILTTSVQSTSLMEDRLDALDRPKVVIEALKLIDSCFRANESLRSVVVEAREEGPSPQIRKEMQARGWEIKIVEEEDESDWDGVSMRSFEDDDDGRYRSDSSGGEYDIDNDSDFWRRAAD